MGRHTVTVVFAACLAALVAVVMGGCSSSGTSGGSMMGGGGSGASLGGGGSDVTGYSSVGQRIYLTGLGSDGNEISRSAPPVSQGSLMMGGGGCGSCHAADGRGGTIRMMTGTAVEAPDITYDAPIEAGYTDATIGDAISDGLDESGKPLDDAMPRWQMSDSDLEATIAYLKELGAQ